MTEYVSSRGWRAAALVLVFLLFVVGGQPEAGLVFRGVLHWLAHLGAYGLIAFVFAAGWPTRPAWQVVLLVALVGALHEGSEIVTHHHPLEYRDILVNGGGALLGVLLRRGLATGR